MRDAPSSSPLSNRTYRASCSSLNLLTSLQAEDEERERERNTGTKEGIWAGRQESVEIVGPTNHAQTADCIAYFRCRGRSVALAREASEGRAARRAPYGSQAVAR